MNIAILSRLTLLHNVISKPLRSELSSIILSLYPGEKTGGEERFLNVYAAYLYSIGLHNRSLLKIANNQEEFKIHLDNLIGFIYKRTSDNLTAITVNNTARALHKTFVRFAESNHIDIPPQSFSGTKVTDYAQRCIEQYQALSVDEDRLEYICGWSISSQTRSLMFVNLDFFYVMYGREFTNKILRSLKNYLITHITQPLLDKK